MLLKKGFHHRQRLTRISLPTFELIQFRKEVLSYDILELIPRLLLIARSNLAHNIAHRPFGFGLCPEHLANPSL